MRKYFWYMISTVCLITICGESHAAGRGPTPGIDHITSVEACDGTLHEFVRDSDSKQLYHRENLNYWHPMGGILTSEPKPVITADCQLRIFARGSGLGIHMRTLTTGWRAYGGISYSAPEVRAVGNDVRITVIGTTNTLWTRTLRRGWGSAMPNDPQPTEFPGVAFGDDQSREPSPDLAATRPYPGRNGGGTRGDTMGIAKVSRVQPCEGKAHLFRRDPYSQALLHRRPGQKLWESFGGILTSEPKAIVDSNCNVQIFVRGAGLGLHRRGLTGAWQALGGTLLSAPFVSLDDSGQPVIRVRGTDDKVWFRTLRQGWRHDPGRDQFSVTPGGRR